MGMMWLKFLAVCLIVTTSVSDAIFKTNPSNLELSNLPFRYELEQVSRDFQEKLRKELSVLEMDMYNEFLTLIQDIDTMQRNVTNRLTTDLTGKVSDMMGKFDKVMAYSKGKTKVLNGQMEEVTSVLGNWVELGVHPSESRRRRRNSRGHDGLPQGPDKNRLLLHVDPSSMDKDFLHPQDVLEVKRLLELDIEEFPVVHDPEIDAFLDTSNVVEESHEARKASMRVVISGTRNTYSIRRNQDQTVDVTEPSAPKAVLPRNCYDLLQEGNTQNGIYLIYPSGKGEGLEVWCDQEAEGGGWTVIISRRSGSAQSNFTTTPTQYAHGIGRPPWNHWIGLDVMHELSQGMSHSLRVHLQNSLGEEAYATYKTFRVGSASENYVLEVGDYTDDSTAGDALSEHSGRPFISPLPDSEEGCSHTLRVGWWYLDEPICYQTLPTGQFQEGNSEEPVNKIEWTPWIHSREDLQLLSFMIRPSTA